MNIEVLFVNRQKKFVFLITRNPRMNRRSVIAGLTPGLILGSGCVALSPRVSGGGLVITNETTTSQTVSFVMLKISKDDDDVPYGNRSRPDQEPLRRWTPTFDVAARESLREEKFITEPGAYYVEVSTETGATDGGWIGLYAAGPRGEALAESYLSVVIKENTLSFSAPTLD